MSEKLELFNLLTEAIDLIQADMDLSYLDAFSETVENILDGGNISQSQVLQEKTISQLNANYRKVLDLFSIDEQTIKEAAELALVKGMKEDRLQANHQMTPNSIGLFIAYLSEICLDDKTNLNVTDLSLGTGNLLATVYYFLKGKDRRIELNGVENDELLIAVSSSYFAMQNLAINLIHGDALDHLLLPPANLMVSDLPVGYYPIDEKAKKYDSSFDEGHSYTHFLLIEQAINYLREGGYGFFVVPTNLFNDEEGAKLLKVIQKIAFMQGFVNLPKEMFQSEKIRKSILILQKQGGGSQQAKEVLLAQPPMFTDEENFKEFIGQVNQWKHNNLSQKGE